MTSLSDRERFLTWMRVEQGRSDRTIEAYGRDIAQYESFLATAKSNSRVVKPAVIEKYVGQLRANERAPKVLLGSSPPSACFIGSCLTKVCAPTIQLHS